MFEEFLVVFTHCRRCQWTLVAGCLFATGFLLAGLYFENQIQFDGPFSALTEPFRQLIHDRYGKAALGVLGASVVATWRAYKKTRKRIFGG